MLSYFQKKKRLIRISKPATKVLGPEYRPNHRRIEIDITYRCNLMCYNCNRSCRQAPSDEHMSIAQIKKFIDESIAKNRKWEYITVMGGEPTLHPKLLEILEALLFYKKKKSPYTHLRLATNGFGKRVKYILAKIPRTVEIINTHKKSFLQEWYYTFNVAPFESKEYRGVDYSNACSVPCDCGIGLNRYGYYPCGNGGSSVDRVFGFNIGRKTLPKENDAMKDQLEKLCPLCGRFKLYRTEVFCTQHKEKESQSQSWINAYQQYKKKRPKLTVY